MVPQVTSLQDLWVGSALGDHPIPPASLADGKNHGPKRGNLPEGTEQEAGAWSMPISPSYTAPLSKQGWQSPLVAVLYQWINDLNLDLITQIPR